MGDIKVRYAELLHPAIDLAGQGARDDLHRLVEIGRPRHDLGRTPMVGAVLAPLAGTIDRANGGGHEIGILFGPV